jgi:hypothetical protein
MCRYTSKAKLFVRVAGCMQLSFLSPCCWSVGYFLIRWFFAYSGFILVCICSSFAVVCLGCWRSFCVFSCPGFLHGLSLGPEHRRRYLPLIRFTVTAVRKSNPRKYSGLAIRLETSKDWNVKYQQIRVSFPDYTMSKARHKQVAQEQIDRSVMLRHASLAFLLMDKRNIFKAKQNRSIFTS